jgi:hypothetical protein
VADEKDDQAGENPSVRAAKRSDRKDRLEAQLRDNLKRRKGQSRGRGESETPGAASRQARSTLIKPE